MGAAKRRGTLEERKANPLGKQANHTKNHADISFNHYLGYVGYLAHKEEQERINKLRGVNLKDRKPADFVVEEKMKDDTR